VLLVLPHLSITEYLRDFFFGALEKMCVVACPNCGFPLQFFGFRLRKVLDLPLLRGRCGQQCCATHVTFLPAFVAPGKWYGYASIQEALEFVVGHGSCISAGLAAWDASRDTRLLSGESGGPSVSTVRRWHEELSHTGSAVPWLSSGQEEVCSRQSGWPLVISGCGPDGLIGETRISPGATPAGYSASPVGMLLGVLVLLGELLVCADSGPPASLFGVGLWFLEGQFGHRCLARADLAGRLIPCLHPDLAVTFRLRHAYPPADP